MFPLEQNKVALVYKDLGLDWEAGLCLISLEITSYGKVEFCVQKPFVVDFEADWKSKLLLHIKVTQLARIFCTKMKWFLFHQYDLKQQSW